MKRASLFFALSLLFGGMAYAFSTYPLTSRLQNVLTWGRLSSPIPQFILDTKHPWLATNKTWLSRYPDVAKEICATDSPLWTSPASPDRALPADLFTNFVIDNSNSRFGSDNRPGWVNARDRLKEMAACQAALVGVRSLHIDINVGDDEYAWYGETTLPPPGLPELFADVLAQMSNLESLVWGVGSEATLEFETAFLAKGLMMPSVKYLRPGARSHYLVSRCPNVEVLESGAYYYPWSWGRDVAHRLDLIRAATGLKNLKEWRLATGITTHWDGWTLEMLEEMLLAAPNITTLRMDGSLNVPDEVSAALEFEDWPYSVKTQKGTLQRYLNVLARFPNLENLQLPSSSYLELGYDGGPGCGNVYDGPSGRAYGRYVAQQYAEATELATNMTLSTMPHLKSLSIGEQWANITVDSRGQPVATWPWTGRMVEWTYEQWEE